MNKPAILIEMQSGRVTRITSTHDIAVEIINYNAGDHVSLRQDEMLPPDQLADRVRQLREHVMLAPF